MQQPLLYSINSRKVTVALIKSDKPVTRTRSTSGYFLKKKKKNAGMMRGFKLKGPRRARPRSVKKKKKGVTKENRLDDQLRLYQAGCQLSGISIERE